MKRIGIAVIVVSVLLCQLVFAGTIDLIGRAGLYSPPGGSGQSYAIYGVAAEQEIAPHLYLRGLVETSTYSVAGNSYSYTPVTLDLIYAHSISLLNVYGGAGVSYNTTTGGGSTSQTSGGELVAGVSTNLMGLLFAGVEGRYIIPDLSNTSRGASAVNCYIGGDISQRIHF
ncbi:MAG: hypothetical protein WC890_02220 [Candidatus Margulisiibacteriota bacterium]